MPLQRIPHPSKPTRILSISYCKRPVCPRRIVADGEWLQREWVDSLDIQKIAPGERHVDRHFAVAHAAPWTSGLRGLDGGQRGLPK